MASLTQPEEVGPLLNLLDSYAGTPQVRAALKMAPLTFVRPKELRHARWKDIDFESSVWRLPIDDTKMKEQDLLVPLSTQAVEILRELQPFTGSREYVFPNARNANQPMSDAAVNGAMRRLDISKDEFCGHGFRAMARTMLDERLGVRTDLIEAQLGHAVKDANGRA
jgi:integrase